MIVSRHRPVNETALAVRRSAERRIAMGDLG
jgi:hypothetical protein